MHLEPEFHSVVAFCAEGVRGNPTGVVLWPGPEEAARQQRLAADLGLPDTVFLTPVEPQRWHARFYSPAEPLTLCVQASLAAHAVLREGGAADPVVLDTPVGPVRVRSLEGAPPDVSWLEFPRDSVRPRAPVAPASEGLGLSLPGLVREAVVDSGRVRLFCELSDRQVLESLEPTPPTVLRFCRAQGISGVCFFVRTGPASVSLRVFTTSLDGGEDAATGGAVLGLSALVRGASGTVQVSQGRGPFHRLGHLLLRDDPGLDFIAVGGRTRRILSGRLTGA
jgi:PhzF family phenazine biosynthesis protein